MNNTSRLQTTLIALFVAAGGFLTIASVLLLRVPFGAEGFLVLNYWHVPRLVVLILGFLAIYLSLQLQWRKRIALYLAYCLFFVLTIIESIILHHPFEGLVYVAILALLFVNRSHFTVRSSTVALRSGLRMAGLIVFLALAYGTIGFYLLYERDFHATFGVFQAFGRAVIEMYGYGNNDLIAYSHYGNWFLKSLDVLGIVTIVLVAASLFRPVRFILGVPQSERRLAEETIRKWSKSTEDFFKLWPADKHYFFEEGANESRALVAYKVARRTALILDGPIGDPKLFEPLLRRFLDFCEMNDWSIAVVHSNGQENELYAQASLKRLHIGQEALINIPGFMQHALRNKHFRYIRNKAVAEGLSTELWPSPLSPAQVAKLKTISDAWLGHEGRREYTFALGYFDTAYLGSCDVMVVNNAQGKPVAYTNLIPTYIPHSRSIDHMRYSITSKPLMHFLLMNVLQELHKNGDTTLNLGLVPLSGIENLADPTLNEQLLAIAKRLGRFYYSFSGLEQFKGKFQPQWEPRYLYYGGHRSSPLSTANALAVAVSIRPPLYKRLSVRFLALCTATVAAVLYSNFPLAYVLNRPLLWNGMVSDLGTAHQPYSWIFNTLDIISGILLTGLSLYLFKFKLATRSETRKVGSRYLRTAVILLGLGGLGGFLSAVIPLEITMSNGSPEIVYSFTTILHMSVTALNTAGIMGAMAFWLAWLHDRHKLRAWQTGLVGSVYGVGLIGLAISDASPGGGFLAQRVFIGLVSIWVVVFANSVWQQHRRLAATLPA